MHLLDTRTVSLKFKIQHVALFPFCHEHRHQGLPL